MKAIPATGLVPPGLPPSGDLDILTVEILHVNAAKATVKYGINTFHHPYCVVCIWIPTGHA